MDGSASSFNGINLTPKVLTGPSAVGPKTAESVPHSPLETSVDLVSNHTHDTFIPQVVQSSVLTNMPPKLSIAERLGNLDPNRLKNKSIPTQLGSAAHMETESFPYAVHEPAYAS